VPSLTLDQIDDLAFRALVASRTSEQNARSVAASITAAEADGIASHGLLRIPIYCAHARSGKVDGHAMPTVVAASASALLADANDGFAHPAIDAGLRDLIPLVERQGVALLAVRNSYNAGVMGHHVEKLAAAGLVAMAFANAPAVMAPWGGKTKAFGTNPIAFAAPREGQDALVIDLASTVVARGEVLLRAKRGESVPGGWGLDAEGHATGDPARILEGGSMLPTGGHKGAALALMVEVLAAALTGARFSFEAGSLTVDDHDRVGIGQAFLGIDPARLAGPQFAPRLEALCVRMMADHGVRLPGARRADHRRRAAEHGIRIDRELCAEVARLAGEKA